MAATEKGGEAAKMTGLQRLMAHFFKSATPEEVADMLRDGAIGKAAEELAKPESAPFVEDRWQDGKATTVPSKKEIKVGPAEAASGSGAEKMTEEYSDKDPQKGAQHQAELLGEMLKEFRSMKSSITGIINEQSFLKSAVVSILEKNASVEQRLAKALKLAKSESEKEDEEESEKEVMKAGDDEKVEVKVEQEEEDEKKAKSLRADARKYLASAKALFAEADRLAKAEKPKSAKSKADLGTLQFSKARSAAEEAVEISESEFGPALLARIEAFGKACKLNPENQNKWPDEGGEKDDRKAKSDTVTADQVLNGVKDIHEMVQKALKGQGMLELTTNQMFDMIAGKSRGDGIPPALKTLAKSDEPADFGALLKSNPEAAMSAKSTEITDLHNGGDISWDEMMQAKNILQRFGLAAAGAITDDVPQAMLARVPVRVQQIFRQAA